MKARLNCKVCIVCHKCGRNGREALLDKVVHLGFTIHTGCSVCKNEGYIYKVTKLDEDGATLTEFVADDKSPVSSWIEPLIGSNKLFSRM